MDQSEQNIYEFSMTRKSPEEGCIAVTGASGYIGRELVDAALESGLTVKALVRKPDLIPIQPNVTALAYDLGTSINPTVLQGVDTIYHLAANTQDTSVDSSQRELQSCLEIVAATKRLRCKLVFISSQTADANHPSRYGQTKALIENVVVEGGGLCVRPGLVFGGREAGLYGSICSVIRRTKFIPVPWPYPTVAPVNVGSLVNLLLRLRKVNYPGSVYCVGDASGIDFGSFVRSVGWLKVGRQPICIPIPQVVMTMTASAICGLGLLNPIWCVRLKSFLATRPMDVKETSRILEITIPSFVASIGDETIQRRRRLLMEAYSLTHYILGTRPPNVALKRYVRVVEKVGFGLPISIPMVLRAWPRCWALFDLPHGNHRAELSRRLGYATKIVEATPDSFEDFIGQICDSRAKAFWSLGYIILYELLISPVRWLLSKVYRPDRFIGGKLP